MVKECILANSAVEKGEYVVSTCSRPRTRIGPSAPISSLNSVSRHALNMDSGSYARQTCFSNEPSSTATERTQFMVSNTSLTVFVSSAVTVLVTSEKFD